MTTTMTPSNITAPTRVLEVASQTYAYRRFGDGSGPPLISQPALVVNGVHDEMIPVRNSYWLGEYLPNAMLLTYPDAGHGSLFQWHESFQHHVSEFLASNSPFAPY